MSLSRLLIATFSIALVAGARGALAQQYYEPPQFTYAQQAAEEAWEQRGFYDGMQGAERDFGNHRRPDVNNREEYRDPDSVPRWARHEYCEGFRHGYYRRVRQIYNGEGAEYRYRHDWR
jgi:hypothetical protein